MTAERVKALAADGGPSGLPSADWSAEVQPDDAGPVPGKRVTVQLRWKTRSGRWDAPVRLTSWVYRRGGSR